MTDVLSAKLDDADRAEELYDTLLPLMQINSADQYVDKVKAQAAILKALSLPITAEPGEVVAWRWRFGSKGGWTYGPLPDERRHVMFETLQPLYACPQGMEVKVKEAIRAFEEQMDKAPTGNPYEDCRKLRIVGTKLISTLTGKE